MPKVRRERTKLHDTMETDAAEEPAEDEEDEDAEDPDAEEDETEHPASRGQRKRLKRRENFMRKFEFVNFVRNQEEKEQKGALGDLGGLASTLDEALQEGSSKRAESKRRMGRKGQAAANEREMAQFQGVLGVAAFQEDPLGALEQHVRNSLKRQTSKEPAASLPAAASKASTRAASRRAGKRAGKTAFEELAMRRASM